MKTQFTLIAVLICSVIFAQESMYVHTASSSNIDSNVTYLDHPDLNNNPSACLNYVHVWNPGGVGGVYNDNTDGLWYNSSLGRWAIYNEDPSIDMIDGASFNVYVADDGQCIDHIATVDNIDGGSTDIDNPLFNGNDPGPYAFMNTYYNPNNVYNPGNWSMYFYDFGNVRSIYEENNTQVPVGAAYKIALPTTSTTRFTHVTATDNISGNYTIIDHPELNDNPDATFLFLHYLGVNGPDTVVQLNATTGVWYTGNRWAIYNEGFEDMPVNVAFDIVIAPNVPVLSVTENTLLEEVSIYPNPSQDVLYVSSPNAAISKLSVISILGSTIMEFDMNDTQKSIDVSTLSPGTYFLKIEAEQAIKTMKFIKL